MSPLCIDPGLRPARKNLAGCIRGKEKTAREKPDGLVVTAPCQTSGEGETSEDGQGRQGKACPKAGKAKNLRASGSGRGKSPRRQKPPEQRGGETPPEGKTSAEAQRGQTLGEGKTFRVTGGYTRI